jgi:anti-sigma B factor antagonist
MPEQPAPTKPEQPPTFGELTVRADRQGDVLTLHLAGEIDLATVDRVEAELEQAEASDARSIVLDLSGLTFMDSTGVRLLLTAHARSRADSHRLSLRRGPVAVQRVLELSGVDTTLPFAD